mmetsp:Transcript_1748/g.3722  ORF Transcript_1748/g.3722 Transcript_1748/m.3722 type:complete len:256 (-) Transcript_1748:541-1308(-)
MQFNDLRVFNLVPPVWPLHLMILTTYSSLHLPCFPHHLASPPIREECSSHSMLLSLEPAAFISLSISIRVDSISLHESYSPLAFVGSTIRPSVFSITMHHVVLPLTEVASSVVPSILANSILVVAFESPYEHRPIFPAIPAPAVLHVVLPLSLIVVSILPPLFAEAVFLPILHLTVVSEVSLLYLRDHSASASFECGESFDILIDGDDFPFRLLYVVTHHPLLFIQAWSLGHCFHVPKPLVPVFNSITPAFSCLT